MYDNACNLRAFCLNPKNRPNVGPDKIDRSRTSIFANINYVVDRLHIKEHVDPVCLKTCHPNLFPDLEGQNTEVCEQTNFWIGKYKYNCKHMNILRFNFFYI